MLNRFLSEVLRLAHTCTPSTSLGSEPCELHTHARTRPSLSRREDGGGSRRGKKLPRFPDESPSRSAGPQRLGRGALSLKGLASGNNGGLARLWGRPRETTPPTTTTSVYHAHQHAKFETPRGPLPRICIGVRARACGHLPG